MLKRLLSMILAVVMVCATFMVVNVNAATPASTETVTITLFDSDAITPFAKTTGTTGGSTTDSYGTANISGTTTALADGVRIASVWGNKGASAEMIDEGDRTNIIKTTEDGTARTTLSFGAIYDNAPAIKDGDVLELSFDHKFVLNANYTNPNFNSALIFDTPYRSKMFGSWGAGSLGNAWVNANSSSGLPQTVTGWGKVSTANGTRYFGPSNNLSYGVGLMDAGKWYNVKITITDPADGTDQKITWTYTALEDGDLIETKNSETSPAQKSYTVTKTLDMDGTTDGKQPLEKATAFGFTFEPKVDDYYDNIKYTLKRSVTKTGCDLGQTIEDVFSGHAGKNLLNYAYRDNSTVTVDGNPAMTFVNGSWVNTGAKVVNIDDRDNVFAMRKTDGYGYNAVAAFDPVSLSAGDSFVVSFDYKVSPASGSLSNNTNYLGFGFTNSDKIAHISSIQTDPYVWYKEGLGILTKGDYQKNAYMPEAILQVRGKGADTAKVTLGYNDGYNGIEIVPNNWYNFEITVNTGDAETAQTITLKVKDSEGALLGTHSAKFDADFTGTNGTMGNASFSGDTVVDKLTSLTGIEFFMNPEKDTTNYFDNVKVVVTNSGVDAYGENVQGSGDNLTFTAGEEIEVAAIIASQAGNGTNFIIAQYDNKGDMINATVYDLSESNYTKTAKFETELDAAEVKLFVFNPGNITPMVEALTLYPNV